MQSLYHGRMNFNSRARKDNAKARVISSDSAWNLTSHHGGCWLIGRPSGATKHWKNTAVREFPTFSWTCILSLLTFSLSELLPGRAFPCVHIVGSLTSKHLSPT